MSNSISENPSVLFGPEPPPGTRLGQYILVEKVASGGMGQVWKAQHETNGKFYALKLLPPMIAAHPDAWEQVLANFHLVEGLSHPNICPVKTLERDQKYGPFLVMGFIEGVTLTRYRRGRAFTAEQVAALLKPVAEALDYAHSQGVIHRDIKHENIMVVLGEDKETIVATYVIDFGLAAEVRTTITQFSQQTAPIAGTLRYMAPEIWRGRPAVSQTDQYALAVIAYELLAGHFPIDGVDRGLMREAVLNEAVEPISGQAASVNEALLKGLAKKPEDRFFACTDLLFGVESVSVGNCAIPLQLVKKTASSNITPAAPADTGLGTLSVIRKDAYDIPTAVVFVSTRCQSDPDSWTFHGGLKQDETTTIRLQPGWCSVRIGAVNLPDLDEDDDQEDIPDVEDDPNIAGNTFITIEVKPETHAKVTAKVSFDRDDCLCVDVDGE